MFQSLLGDLSLSRKDKKKRFLTSYSQPQEEEEVWQFATPKISQKDYYNEPVSFSSSTQDTKMDKNSEEGENLDLVETDVNEDYDNAIVTIDNSRGLGMNSSTKGGYYDMTNGPMYYNSNWATCEKIPSLIEAYINVLMKTILKVLIISWIGALLWTLIWDVDKKLKTEESHQLKLAEDCRYNFNINNWDGDNLPLVLEQKCKEFQYWMTYEQDQNTLYWKIAAGLVAEVLNDFFETLSYNTLGKFWAILIIFLTLEIPYAQYKRLSMKSKWLTSS